MCRFTTAIGVRIIGFVTLIACLINIVRFPDSLHSFYEAKEVRVTLFLKLAVEDIYNKYEEEARMNLKVLEMFSYLCVLSSCLLIWGSIVCNRLLTVPWLVCTAVDVVFQIFQLAHIPRQKMLKTWDIAESVFRFLVSVLASGYVLYAAYQWMKKNEEGKEEQDVALAQSETPHKKRYPIGSPTKFNFTCPV